MTTAPRSAADRSLKIPPNDPIGVRQALTITASSNEKLPLKTLPRSVIRGAGSDRIRQGPYYGYVAEYWRLGSRIAHSGPRRRSALQLSPVAILVECFRIRERV